jgi:hypothetical protein
LAGEWGYCLTAAPISSTRIVACVGESLPSSLAAAIQQNSIPQQITTGPTQQEQDGMILGIIFGLIGFGGIMGAIYYVYRTGKFFRASRRKISNADEQSGATDLAILAMRPRPHIIVKVPPTKVISLPQKKENIILSNTNQQNNIKYTN